MTLIFSVLLLLVVMSSGVRSQTKPTREEICAKPIFDGGLAFTDVKGKRTEVFRWLFYHNWIFPYLWDSHTIDWPNVASIHETFKGTPASFQNGIRLAFGTTDKAFLIFKGDKEIYSYDKNGKEFTMSSAAPFDKVGFPYIMWNVTTAGNGGPTSKSMLFFDSNPIESGSKKEQMEAEYHGGKFKIEYSSALNKEKIRVPIEIFPNTLYFENAVGNKIKIPVEFDTYYQTMDREAVFFKGEGACAYEINPLTYKDQSYCHTFVDTRSLIGCAFNETEETWGPEVFPGEPPETIDT